MPSSFTLDGQRYSIPAQLPTYEIMRLVGAMHVADTDEEVRAAIAARAATNPGWTAPMVKAAQRYALYCHRRNQKLYRFVATGSR